MKKLFGYDSKFMRALGKYSDMLFLNALFIICCIPIVTIGAAQSALYSGMRALQDNYDCERSCYGAFFHGFRTGFLKITAVWCLLCSFTAVSLFNLFTIAFLNVVDPYAPVWISVMAVVISAIITTPIPLFHSRFGCTAFQLIRNAGVIAVCNPLITLLQTILLWFPVVLFFWDMPLFITITPLWLLGYYSIVSMIGVKLFNRSFRMLEENFYAQQETEQECGDDEAEVNEDTDVVEDAVTETPDADADVIENE